MDKTIISKENARWMVIALFVVIIGFDIFLAVDSEVGNTYSEVLRDKTNSWWWMAHLVTAGCGLLAWHWFRNNAAPGDQVKGRKSKHLLNLLLLILSFIVGIAFCELIGFY